MNKQRERTNVFPAAVGQYYNVCGFSKHIICNLSENQSSSHFQVCFLTFIEKHIQSPNVQV